MTQDLLPPVAAIMFSLTIDDHMDARTFLENWSEGDQDAWADEIAAWIPENQQYMKDAKSLSAGEIITNLWFEEYVNKEKHLCGLCGNQGVIDTRGRARSPAGVEAGIQQRCICPNGRHEALR